ncbi:GNAT family N-acetyltransferase [Motilimonas eburnea]|uniref:GNAT family N-acetyltransferase n=1 Tax=Motilimonas eburnea TaxID=1737488 RepID=UPI001E41E62E|nr:GNAT family N-acetyltransferase [Motilimonas eburnea]MCE2571533.1 GNAT family N-acetyltransferase [Motilimonas eburnea]
MLVSKTIQLRLVQEDDAEFISELRSNKKYNKHLSKSDTNVDAQKLWIREYKEKEELKEQFYFIIERLDGTRCGTVRLYDFREGSFCWGSWILNQDKTRYASIESALLVYEFGFKELGCAKSHFDVRKENYAVCSFHEKFGAKQVGETELDNLYVIYPEDVNKMIIKCKKIFEKL